MVLISPLQLLRFRLPLILLFAFPLWGLTGQTSFKAELGFNGIKVPMAWVPLSITLQEAPNDSNLMVRKIDAEGQVYAQEVFPANTSAIINTAVFLDHRLAKVQLSLYNLQGLIEDLEINPYQNRFPGHIILACRLPGAIRQSIAKILEPDELIKVPAITLEQLPSQALMWDAVSALVISDPGPILSPDQRSSMVTWLSAGGIVVLLEARRGDQSLLSQLLPNLQSKEFDQSQVISPLGHGRIIQQAALKKDATMILEPSFWRATLQLSKYQQHRRWNPSSVFAMEESRLDQLPPQESHLGILLILSASFCGIIMVVSFLNKRKLLIITLSALVTCLAILIFQEPITQLWDRGLQTSACALILPGDSGTLVSIETGFSKQKATTGLEMNSSPWGLETSFDHPSNSAKGKISADGLSLWQQETAFPLVNLAGGTPRSQHLIGLFPNSTLNKADPILRLVIDGQNLRWLSKTSAGSWNESTKLPNEIIPYQNFISRLAQVYPGYTWEIGLATSQAWQFKVIKNKINSIIWVQAMKKQP